jgi:hypothetical protein
VKSLVVGRPILLALEDIDGSPSFLEKALCFVEQYGKMFPLLCCLCIGVLVPSLMELHGFLAIDQLYNHSS